MECVKRTFEDLGLLELIHMVSLHNQCVLHICRRGNTAEIESRAKNEAWSEILRAVNSLQ